MNILDYLRAIIGFGVLTFVPGLLLLKIFRINNLSTIEKVLYSVGLSIVFIIFVGSICNFVFPIFGIDRPISFLPVVLSISVSIMILFMVVFIRRK